MLCIRNVNLHEIFCQGYILNISEFRSKSFRLQTPVTRSAQGSRGREIQATTEKGINSICRYMEMVGGGGRCRMERVVQNSEGWRVQDGEGRGVGTGCRGTEW